MASDGTGEQEQLKRELDRLRQFLHTDSEDVFLISDSDPTGPDESSSSVSILTDLPTNSIRIGSSSDVFSTSTSASANSTKKRNLRRCLDLNLNYQATIHNYLDAIRQAKVKVAGQIADKKQKINDELLERRQRNNKRPTPVVYRPGPLTLPCFRQPYFKNVFDTKPPANIDVQMKTYRGEMLPGCQQFSSGWKWFDETATNRFFREVRHECLSTILQPHVSRREELRQLAGEVEGAALSNVLRELETVESTIKQVVRENSSEKLFHDADLMAAVDWMKIAKRFGGTVSHTTCRLVWQNYHSPLINKSPFTAKEDKLLVRLVKAQKFCNWTEIARKLKSGRSVFQCLQRYQSKFRVSEESAMRENERRKDWSAEDDARLLGIIKGIGMIETDSIQYIDWTFVAQHMGNFSESECCDHYVNLALNTNSGPWSRVEDRKLELAVQRYGCNWITVATFVENRSPRQCALHWERIFKPTGVHSVLENGQQPEWTAEEDAVLWFNRNSKSVYLRRYCEIVRFLPGRLVRDVKARFKTLQSWYKHAEFLVKNDGTLLSLIVKSDAELTIAEVAMLRDELIRLKTIGRHKRVALSKTEAEQLGAVSFQEQSELERLTNAMVLEASLSRDLVCEKVKLIKAIVDFKAVPVPLLRNMPRAGLHRELRAAAFEKIREMLLRINNARKTRMTRSLTKKQPTISKARHFASIMAKIKKAMDDPNMADCAHEILLRLENVNAGTRVNELIVISHQLDALARKAKPPQATCRASPNQWKNYNFGTCCLFEGDYRPKAERLAFYDDSVNLRITHAQQVNSIYKVSKLYLLVLGGKLSSIAAEAHQQSQSNCDDVPGTSDVATSLNVQLPPVKEDPARRLKSYVFRQTVPILLADLDGFTTGLGTFSSIREEFRATCNVFPEEFSVETTATPTLPPNIATASAYRHLSNMKSKLTEIVAQTGANGEHLLRKVEKLRTKPSSEYATLKRRFEALFSWPAVLAKCPPRQGDISTDWCDSASTSEADFKPSYFSSSPAISVDSSEIGREVRPNNPEPNSSDREKKISASTWRGRGREFALALAERAVRRHQESSASLFRSTSTQACANRMVFPEKTEAPLQENKAHRAGRDLNSNSNISNGGRQLPLAPLSLVEEASSGLVVPVVKKRRKEPTSAGQNKRPTPSWKNKQDAGASTSKLPREDAQILPQLKMVPISAADLLKLLSGGSSLPTTDVTSPKCNSAQSDKLAGFNSIVKAP